MRKVLIILLLMQSCSKIDKKESMDTSNNELEILIDKTSYADLFLSSDYTLLKKIWNEGENEEQLKQFIKNEKTKAYTKLKAAEVLFYFKKEISINYYKSLSDAYTYCLLKTSYEEKDYLNLSGNLWGFLYEQNDVGVLGSRFLLFKEKSIYPLKKVLESGNEIIQYEGSEESVIGELNQYRVKDFAAFYISKIKNIPITFYQDFDKRDAEIERLKEVLKNK